MTARSLEERLRDAASAAAGGGSMPDEVLRGVRSHRRLRGVLAAGAAAIAVAGVVAVPVVIAGNGSNGHSVAGSGTAKSKRHQELKLPIPPAPPTFAPIPAPLVPTDAPEPATFLASIGAGAERLAVVDTQTGQVRKWLQQNGSQLLMTFSADLSRAYQPELRGCTSTWTQIDTHTGASAAAFTGLGRPLEVALAPSGTRVAYVHLDGGSLRTGCPLGNESLVVKDETSGATRSWAIGPGGGDSLYPVFDPTGMHVAFVRAHRVWILDVNQGLNLRDAVALSAQAPAHGCSQNKPVWRPGSSTVLVTLQCQSSASIVGYSATTGRETYRHDIPGTDPFLAAFAVDASGKHVIYALSGSFGAPGGNVYAVEGRDRHIVDGAYQVAW